MKLSSLFLCLLPLVAAPVLLTTDAHACGGCFVQQTETSQVTGHRMILSISNDQTTLWDQITYSGNPVDFSWVLPIKGQVEIGLSSDALFKALESATDVSISSPSFSCLPPDCQFGPPNAGSGASSGSGGGGVTVIAQEVVGPFATVQLQASDPNALADWLAQNGYNLPADIQPVVAAYVNEGFGFLAMKLAPGQGIDSMRPVRITAPGAQPSLPLRMVAAGTGLSTPITLWVMGEGRYEPANFDSFTVAESDLTWNWDVQRSDYAEVVQQRFDDSMGSAWLVAAAEQFSRFSIEEPLRYTAQFDPANSGYGSTDPMGPTPLEECDADLADLFGTIPDNSLWVTRLRTELARPALSNDLILQASPSQATVDRFLQITNETGTRPECPPPPDWCTSTSSSSSSSGNNNPWDDPLGNGGGRGSSGCAVAGDSESPVPTALGLLCTTFVMSLAYRRSRRSRSKRSS